MRRTRSAWAMAAALVASGMALVAGPAPASAAPTCQASGGVVTCTFASIGGPEQWTVPDGVTSLEVTLLGAAGGDSGSSIFPVHSPGGKGARLVATVPVTPGEVLQVNVGGKAPGLGNGAGGWNGGGAYPIRGGSATIAGGGGGASDIRRGAFALADRIVVAGGGGGAGGNSELRGTGDPGGAGGDSGDDGRPGTGTAPAGPGLKGTLTAGGAGGAANVPAIADFSLFDNVDGSPGSLGNGGNTADSLDGGGGGGGGGYYGGGGGAGGLQYFVFTDSGDTQQFDTAGSGGGGGSSFAAPTVANVALTDGFNAGQGSIAISFPGRAPAFGGPLGDVAVDTGPGACSAVNVTAPSFSVSGLLTPTVSFSPSLTGPFPVGATTVTATASNGIAPTATTAFTVRVQDREAPTISAQDDLTVTATSAAGAVVDFPAPTASDNCPNVTVTRTAGPAPGSTFLIGTTPVRYRAQDASGNTADLSFDVIVSGTAPTLAGTPPAGTAGTGYSFTYDVGGIPTPSLTAAGDVPPGLSLSPAGVLSGTPTRAGTFLFTVTAANGLSPDATAASTVTVEPGAPASLSVVGGDGQTTQATAVFPTRLAVAVKDAFGNPVPGVSVSFTASARAAFGGAATASAVSGSDGVATAPALTAGTATGPVSVTATSGTLAGVTFTATVSRASADLKVTIAAPSTVARGGTYTATVTVTNQGPSLSGATISGLVAGPGVRVVSAAGGTAIGNSVVSVASSPLAAGSSRSYTVTLKAPNRAGAVGLTANVLSLSVNDPTTADNTTTASTRVG